MVFNDFSTRKGVSVTVLNDQTSDKAQERCAGRHDRDELPPFGPMGKNLRISSGQNRLRKSSLSERRSSFLLSPSDHDQSQLHRRNNKPRKTGSQRGKENVPPLFCQPSRTHTAKIRRPVLADVSNADRGVPFAGSTSIQSPSRKVGNGEPGTAGLRFELDHKPFRRSDSQETVTQNSFMPVAIEAVDYPAEFPPESTHASPVTPLREALASFNDMVSSTFVSPAKKSISNDDPPYTSRLSFRPSSPGLSISNAFNLSTLADSISQFTGDIAASIVVCYEHDYLFQGQYHEDAVARDEKFHWEEEMKCLEVQCGLYGDTK